MKLRPPKLTTARLCGAPRRGGKGLCCRPASKGKTRCRLHGALATGPTTAAGLARAVAAMIGGRALWMEKQRRLKQAGVIARCPGGRPTRPGSPAQARDGSLSQQATRLATEGAATMPKPASRPPLAIVPSPELAPPASPPPAPVAAPRAWAAQGHSERLDTLTNSAMDRLRDILDQPTALTDPKMLSIQKDAALSVIAAKIKVESGKMQRRNEGETLTKLLACIRAGEAADFLD